MNKMIIKTLVVSFMLSIPVYVSADHASSVSQTPITLTDIKNFNKISPFFASSGMPTSDELVVVKNQGYQHVINLLPGDYSAEQTQVESLQMTFNQIAVDWSSPTLKNFQDFVALMKPYEKANEKVFVHCYINYRASVFSYLYQVTQQDVDDDMAKQKMLDIFKPKEAWQQYIEMVKQHYKRQS